MAFMVVLFNGKFLLRTVFNENVLQNIMKFNKYMNRSNKIIYYLLPQIKSTQFVHFFGGGELFYFYI
jgi:hypothetical protein